MMMRRGAEGGGGAGAVPDSFDAAAAAAELAARWWGVQAELAGAGVGVGAGAGVRRATVDGPKAWAAPAGVHVQQGQGQQGVPRPRALSGGGRFGSQPAALAGGRGGSGGGRGGRGRGGRGGRGGGGDLAQGGPDRWQASGRAQHLAPGPGLGPGSSRGGPEPRHPTQR